MHGVADPDSDLVRRGVGGATGDRQRRRLLEIDVRRLREQRAGLDVGLGAVCTGEAVPDDLVAHREPFDAWTDRLRLDPPGCLVARNGRELPSTAGVGNQAGGSRGCKPTARRLEPGDQGRLRPGNRRRWRRVRDQHGGERPGQRTSVDPRYRTAVSQTTTTRQLPAQFVQPVRRLIWGDIG